MKNIKPLQPGPMLHMLDGYQLQYQACSAPSHGDFCGVTFVTGNPAIAGPLSPCTIHKDKHFQESVVSIRLILQRLSNLRTTFVSKWVHDASRHFQLESSHQITSETAILIVQLSTTSVIGDDIGVGALVRFAELQLTVGTLIS